MANERSSADCKQDISSWLQSVVHYVKDTQAKCLDLRTVPDDTFKTVREDTFRSGPGDASRAEEPIVVDIEPILDSLIGSSVTEIHIENPCFTYKVQQLLKVLAETRIEKLNFCPYGSDDILSLTPILKDTKITDLAIIGKGHFQPDRMSNELVAHLVNSYLKSTKLTSTRIVTTSKVSVLFRSLPSTQITSLDLSALFFLTTEDCTEPLQILMSNLQDTAITDLNLTKNKLSDSSAQIISAGLENSKLEKLNLYNNQLTSTGVDFLVPGLIRSKITHLNLGRNFIENAFDKLGNLLKDTKLRELNLSVNPLLEERRFLDHFCLLRGLFPEPLGSSSSTDTSFAGGSNPEPLGSNSTKDTMVPPISIKELKSSKLTHLDLSFNKLNLEQISALVDYLIDSELIHLNLYRVVFPIEGFCILGEGLKRLKLKSLNVGGTGISIESNVTVASFLEYAKGLTIASLNLSGNFLLEDYGINVLKLASTTFLELDLSSNGWNNHMTSLAEQLKSMAITALYLDSSDIGDDGVTILSECLQETQVVLLSVKKNGITSIGAKALAFALKTTKLRHLDLESNKIENDGLESLAQHIENSCLTYLNISQNPGRRKLLVDGVLWENRRKIRKFADLLKQTAFFTGDSNIFEFDRDFGNTDIEVFIEDCLEIYRMASREPFIVAAIEQDKHILDLKKLKWSTFSSEYSDEVFFEDCEFLYKKILEQPSSVQGSSEKSVDASVFKKQILWLILKCFPTKLNDFINRRLVADVEEHVSLLRKIEELEHPVIVELLLLNRPNYVIDKKEDILHPYVYKLLFKYDQPMCNTEIEPEGFKKIIQYFTEHMDMQYASEAIMLLNIKQLQQAK